MLDGWGEQIMADGVKINMMGERLTKKDALGREEPVQQ